MSKKNKKELERKLNDLARQRGIDRKHHFANGGSMHDWRGGLHTVQKDKRKEKSKRACRGKNWD